MPRQREGGASRQPRRMAFHEVMGSLPISSTSPGARSASRVFRTSVTSTWEGPAAVVSAVCT
jgi:hypothetical protein